MQNFLLIIDPDPPESVAVTHNGTNRARVTWNSPGCNGGPVRAVRVTLYSGDSGIPTYFETNTTNWKNTTGVGSFIIDNYEFEFNVEYRWTVAILYDYRDNGTVWSQNSSTVLSRISGA